MLWFTTKFRYADERLHRHEHSTAAFLLLLCCGSLWAQVRLRRTFLAVQGNEGRRRRQERKWISVPISSRAPHSDPRRISNTMFYKLMFLEVGQGYPRPRRRRHNSSVRPKGFGSKVCSTEKVFEHHLCPISHYDAMPQRALASHSSKHWLYRKTALM